MNRIGQLQHRLSELEGDAVCLTHLPHIRWACGFTGSNGLLIATADAAHFITDGRYRTQAAEEVDGAEVHTPGYDLVGYLADAHILESDYQVVFDADRMTVSRLAELRDRVPGSTWTGIKDLLALPVASKDADEVDAIRAAQRLTESVYDHLLDWLDAGSTEKDIAAEITYQHLVRGAERMSFDPIVASGPNSALPHARPTDRRVEPGDVVLLDFGCMLGGYASDMTRVVVVGEPRDDVWSIYDLVRSAQERALESARAGLLASDLDAEARSVISEAGYGDAFSHGLGHGVGLEVHEWPRVSYSSDVVLPEGSVISIEPGIYLPGQFGIRIEDLIVLRDDGCENLTHASKEWTILRDT